MSDSERMRILSVSRWIDVFETAESRRYRTLTWIAIPVSFNSTGLQRLLDDFDGNEAAALYGCWNALLKVAATAPVRGVLAGQKGEPYTSGRLARLSGFPRSLFVKLIDWCLSVGWLVDTQAVVELPDLTGPDLTEQNKTGPDRTGPEKPNPAGPARSGDLFFLNKLTERAQRKPGNEKLIELLIQPVSVLIDSQTPQETMQCWNKCGWSDEIITQMGLTDRRAIARQSLWEWFRRQLAAPDPIVSEPTMAAALWTLVVGEMAATRPGLSKRVGWFRSRLSSRDSDRTLDEIPSKTLTAAARFLAAALSAEGNTWGTQ